MAGRRRRRDGGGRCLARVSYNMIDIWKLLNNPRLPILRDNFAINEHEPRMRLAIAEARAGARP